MHSHANAHAHIHMHTTTEPHSHTHTDMHAHVHTQHTHNHLHGRTHMQVTCVWAVDCLTGVVLSGLPRGAVNSSKASSAPKAVLWGMDSRTVKWLQPEELAAAHLAYGAQARCVLRSVAP